MLRVDESAAIGGLMEKAQRIQILIHRDNDPDCMGSGLGLALILQAAGKQCQLLNPDGEPSAPMKAFYGQGLTKPLAGPADLIIVCDAANEGRLGEVADHLHQGIPVVVIDHHADNAYPNYGDLHFIDTKRASTAELIYLLAQQLNLPVPMAAAADLYAGIYSDTGGFANGTADTKTFNIAAELAKTGINLKKASRMGLSSRREKFALEVEALRHAKFEMDGKLALVTIKSSLLRRTGATVAEASGLVARLAAIDGVAVAAALIEYAPPLSRQRFIRLQLRSNAPCSARRIAHAFGGGGHEGSAGAHLQPKGPRLFGIPMRRAAAAVTQAARHEIQTAAAAPEMV